MDHKGQTYPPNVAAGGTQPQNPGQFQGQFQGQLHNQGAMSTPNPYPPSYLPGNNVNGPSPDTTPQQVNREESESGERDIFSLTPHVEVNFDNTFQESDTAKSFSFMKKVNEAIYNYTHFAMYATLSLIIAPIATFVWAMSFAVIHMTVIWFIHPFIKILFILFRVTSLILEVSVRVVCDPCFKSAALVFSSIKGSFQVKESNINVVVKKTPLQEV